MELLILISIHTNIINVEATACLFVTLSRHKYWTDFYDIWYRDSLKPREGHRLPFVEKIFGRGEEGVEKYYRIKTSRAAAAKMDSEYDQKFEEMKKYIPFLENMIKRLESTNLTANPRKAQLDKIRSLRDLLLDKKKRMKMENLLKCEQVLINLYAKVEQRDAMADVTKVETDNKEEKEKTELNAVRNKLKSVASKLQDDPDTLPEIARANNAEVNCTPGSKEPALFQRRPNKASSPHSSPNKHDSTQSKSISSKRNYTRVLLSPERKTSQWPARSGTDESHKEKQLFSRRSPRRSPRRYSPSYHKRERKKSIKPRSESQKYSKDLNITLKVPEESLGSLNTKDILSRILNCHDNDVDIATLRELRTQILGELKQTGAKDDISDLILKSYANKVKPKKNDEIEEGELSDSESEAIESIYGSLVIMDKDLENSNTNKSVIDKDTPRKIQICLVINSDREKYSEQNHITKPASSGIEGNADDNIAEKSTAISQNPSKPIREESEESKLTTKSTDASSNKSSLNTNKEDTKQTIDGKDVSVETKDNTVVSIDNKPSSSEPFKPNFYQPLIESTKSEGSSKGTKETPLDVSRDLKCKQQLPFLETDKSAKTSEETDALSQIDILQALKKEILGETVTAKHSEVKTPPLHQPKITKVVSAQEIMSKKRISIENYKQKSITSAQQKLSVQEQQLNTSKDDSSKKQSLKLTEKECERFNLTSLTSDTSDEDISLLSTDDICVNSAPKSPDHEDFADMGIKPPVIIPIDPVKTVIVNSKADVDMRTIMPLGQSCNTDILKKGVAPPNISVENLIGSLKNDEKFNNEIINSFMTNSERNPITNYSNNTSSMIPGASPMSPCITPNIVPLISPILGRNPIIGPNMTTGMPPSVNPVMPSSINPMIASSLTPSMSPTMNPVMTSNMAPRLSPSMNSAKSPNINPSVVPNMHPGSTPNRNPCPPSMNICMTPIITPNARSYEMTLRNSFDNDDYTGKHVYAPMFSSFDGRDYSENDVYKKRGSHSDVNDLRNNSNQRDMDFQRNRNDRYKGDVYSPRTDSPGGTPTSSFGRMESPHPFVRSDRSVTPFGRSEPNMNSNNAFSRTDFHNNSSFSNQKYDKTPDPRYNRSADYDMYQSRYDERERSYYKGSYSSGPGYRRDNNTPGTDRNNSYDNSGRNRRERKHYGESISGHSYSRDYGSDRPYNRDRIGNDYRYHGENARNFEDSKRNYREKSVGRTESTEDRFPSSLRDGGAIRHGKKSDMENRGSVQPLIRRSFNIGNTSSNKTFPESTSSRNNFEARRQRAASVGRMLVESAPQKQTFNINFERSISDNERKRTNFRRASSVGRDLEDYYKNKNFKDVKADLQSSKFKSFSRDTKNESNVSDNKISGNNARHKYNDPLKSREPRTTKDVPKKTSDNIAGSTYSPRRNYRDPRVRREMYETNSRDKNKNQENSRWNKHGIVYSSDNIAKGTILGPGCGVRNYKIPKIKRPIVCQPDIGYNKVDESNKNHSSLNIDDKNAKSVNNKPNEKTNVHDNKEKPHEDKPSDIKSNKDIGDLKTKKHESNQEAVSSTIKKGDKNHSQDDDVDSFNSASDCDNSERRITRSAKAKKVNVLQTKVPKVELRRLQRVKRLLIDDSDSDSQSSGISDKVIWKKGEEKSLQSGSAVTKKATESVGKQKSEGCNNNQDVIVRDSERCGKSTDNENVMKDSKNTENPEKINTKDKDTECKRQRDSLDRSFGTDDDLSFSENFKSEAVNNIDSLIADLDNDIEAPKVNDLNVKSINNIVENKLCPQPSLLQSEQCLSHTTMKNKNNLNKDTLTLNVDDKGKTLDSVEGINNSCVLRSEDKTEIKRSENALNSSDVENNISNKINPPLEMSGRNDKSNPQTQSNDSGTSSNIRGNEQINDFTRACNEAIVSTTAGDSKISEIPKESQSSTSIADTACVSSIIPDSTFSMNEVIEKEDSQQSVPDSTNQTSTEMNSDITSTRNLVDTDQKVSDLTLFSDNLPRIDSIEKLLSILEDKNKIKELLSLIGNQSGDNEKIKKKLEKLSEIVSDEEEITESESKTNVKSESKMQVKSESTMPSLGTNKNSDEDSKIDSVSKLIDTTAPEVKNQELEKESKDGNIAVKPLSIVDEHNEKKDTVEIKTSYLKDNDSINITDSTMTSDKQIDDDLTTNAPVSLKQEQKMVKRHKPVKKGKGRFTKKAAQNKEKRVTRSEASTGTKKVSGPKKPSRELLKLHEDIREMFISDDVLNATGIRMCRLAKMVEKEDALQKEETNSISTSEKGKNKTTGNDSTTGGDKPAKKKTGKGKSHSDFSENDNNKEKPSGSQKCKPGPKSKTKRQDDDPYVFETDSVVDSNVTVDSGDQSITDSDSNSIESSKSFETSDLLIDVRKKLKRKGLAGKVGAIMGKNKKKKGDSNETEMDVPISSNQELPVPVLPHVIPDLNCFTDKSYCYLKDVQIYSCRLCTYTGDDIVPHYKENHPHSEVPLSRISPETAQDAIEQCQDLNLKAVSKIHTDKYVCRFCSLEFKKKGSSLETFFWHVVSTHTGEYKQICSECLDVTKCPYIFDIPAPPKNLKGQLLGYICARCNYTQVSLENLKTHVIVRHNDVHTEVFSINLSLMSKKTTLALLKKCDSFDNPRVLRSSRSNQSMTEQSDDRSDYTESSDNASSVDTARTKINEANSLTPESPEKNIQSKIAFENDDINEASDLLKHVKMEHEDENDDNASIFNSSLEQSQDSVATDNHNEPGDDTLLSEAHFKIDISDTGSKEYICCINGNNHYSTTLLISLKKHVQLKHSEIWDGYCCVCKVIVTPQGKYHFKDCLQHFLDKHMDNFPIMEEKNSSKNKTDNDSSSLKSFINVRPLSELIPTSTDSQDSESNSTLPKIESVVSLGAHGAEDLPSTTETQTTEREYKYEEAQTDIMSKKHRVVLDTMMSPEKLIEIFKCSGRFCSYTTDDAEEALLHASTHQRIGGDNALVCSYCDFDPSSNAIDLVMHVFKAHSHCPYVCSLCFYRAPASQLVNAHMKRAHTDESAKLGTVLLSTNPGMRDSIPDDMLPRDAVVPYYICNNGDGESGSTCKFKTYVSIKFSEHLQLKHATDTEYSCYICYTTLHTPKLLCQHLKTHGLHIYQCARCVCGADTEAEMLAHASATHPLKQPKAYLRIITTKEGSSEVRVLPLAILNTSQVPTSTISPSTDKENPVKQAERSIDLEKLIGHTTFMIRESVSTATQPSSTTEIEDITDATAAEQDTGEIRSSVICGTPKTSTVSSETQLVIKQEPTEKPPVKDKVTDSAADIVCLDSDEESNENIIDLSHDETVKDVKESDINKVIPTAELYKCSKCNMVYKTEGKFKKHILACFCNVADPIPCAHCSFKANRFDIVSHYTKNHRVDDSGNLPFRCAICSDKYVSMVAVKNHLKVMHKVTSLKVTTHTTETGVTLQIVDGPALKYKKRKLPNYNTPKIEPPAKLKKYGPQDVDRLPINPILDELVYCSLCKFNTKVRLNMVRHLQLHAEQQPVPVTAPVNPVPHLETNEKHFDKMVNLASSSIVNRADKASKSEGTPAVSTLISPEVASRFPKYVPDRQRYTCGAKGCSYISVNETMLKCHWETLHSGTNDYHCVHCPPNQHLDTSQPLTAARIMSHLNMHDTKLYSCSTCPFYHFMRKIVENHISRVHKTGSVMIVRDEGQPVPAPLPQPVSAPTMDLKAWQCGLCKYKSMLRPEVADHCAKFHQSKMQYKCAYCGFRTSNVENVTKHQMNSHPEKPEEIFYFYYREGSVPDEEDGTPRWLKQKQKTEVPEIKTEKADDTTNEALPRIEIAVPPTINLDIVKKEVDFDIPVEETVEDLCNMFGQFCEPNGLKYKCSLCKNVIEDSQEAMQSHLYEELQYRKWGCGICSYKAFHKPGLQEHMQIEHRQNREPVELEIDLRKEKWVAQLLEYQTSLINKYKENLAKQKAEILRSAPGISSTKPPEIVQSANTKAIPSGKPKLIELKRYFGDLGVASNLSYCCPKCQIKNKSEATMREHLLWELNKIRWRCNGCAEKFQTYHEAQFHCKSRHPRTPARPVEAPRDDNLRAAWVAAVIHVQNHTMNHKPVSESKAQEVVEADPSDNSLLVVRFEKKVPTPEEEMQNAQQGTDSDEDKLVIDEPKETKKQPATLSCPFCPVMFKVKRFLDQHILKHYNLEPLTCDYCDYSSSKKQMLIHHKTYHDGKQVKYHDTPRPSGAPECDKVPKVKRIDSSKGNVDKVVHIESENSRERLRSESNDESTESAAVVLDSDDDKLVIEEGHGRRVTEQTCPHCQATVKRNFHGHTLKHYNLEPFTCGYCDFTGTKRWMILHQTSQHQDSPIKYSNTPIPNYPPSPHTAKKATDEEPQKVVCMVCERLVSDSETQTHLHDGLKPEYSNKGAVVVKCCVCLTLHKDIIALQLHHDSSHPDNILNYAFYKLHKEKNRGITSHCCGYCEQRFTYLRDLKTHSNAMHSTLKLKYTTVPSIPDLSNAPIIDMYSEEVGSKRLPEDGLVLPPAKRVARKSTTKLPEGMAVAKKSTTKLPFEVEDSVEMVEYSHYGTKPTTDNLENVTTLMPFYNTMVPFTLHKLSEIINLNPVVLIEDIHKKDV